MSFRGMKEFMKVDNARLRHALHFDMQKAEDIADLKTLTNWCRKNKWKHLVVSKVFRDGSSMSHLYVDTKADYWNRAGPVGKRCR